MDNLISALPEFFQTHLLLGIAGAVILVILFFIRPGAMLKVLTIFIVLGLILYFISLFGGSLSTGIGSKDEMIHKSEETIK